MSPFQVPLYDQLDAYHGVTPNEASEAIHEIKAAFGLPPDYDLLFDMTGNVYDAATGDWLASITEIVNG